MDECLDCVVVAVHIATYLLSSFRLPQHGFSTCRREGIRTSLQPQQEERDDFVSSVSSVLVRRSMSECLPLAPGGLSEPLQLLRQGRACHHKPCRIDQVQLACSFPHWTSFVHTGGIGPEWLATYPRLRAVSHAVAHSKNPRNGSCLGTAATHPVKFKDR